MNKTIIGVFREQINITELMHKLKANSLRTKHFSIYDSLYFDDKRSEDILMLQVDSPEEKVPFIKSVFKEYKASDIKILKQNVHNYGSKHVNHSHHHLHLYATVGTKGGRSKKTK